LGLFLRFCGFSLEELQEHHDSIHLQSRRHISGATYGKYAYFSKEGASQHLSRELHYQYEVLGWIFLDDYIQMVLIDAFMLPMQSKSEDSERLSSHDPRLHPKLFVEIVF